MRSYGQYCAVAKALDVIGDRWNLLIVRELLLRDEARYTDVRHGLPGIATNLLTERLRELEAAGVVERHVAPPPVAATLFRLTDRGRRLAPVLQALGEWGTQFMVEPRQGEVFRSHWLVFPVSVFLRAPDDAAAYAIEVRTGDQPAVIEVSGAEVTTRLGTAVDPVLVLTGDAPPVLGLLTGALSVSEAEDQGVVVDGDVDALHRLRPPVALPAGS